MAWSLGELRPIDRAELVLGRPLKGNLRDAQGRVLICAKATLTPAHLKQLGTLLITGLYGGADWGSPDDSRVVPASEVVGDLFRRAGLCEGTLEQRAHQRHKWQSPLTLLLAEHTTMGIVYREIHAGAVDLSRGGFAFMYRQYIAVNTSIRAQFDQLPNRPRVEGVVRSCRLLPRCGHRVGVQFVHPSELPEVDH